MSSASRSGDRGRSSGVRNFSARKPTSDGERSDGRGSDAATPSMACRSHLIGRSILGLEATSRREDDGEGEGEEGPTNYVFMRRLKD